MKDKLSEDRIELLHPKFRDVIKKALEEAESVIDSNLAIRVVQGLRTIEYQNELYAQGRTKLFDKDGKRLGIVTNAKGGTSPHNYGVAIDVCWLFKQPDGTYKYDDKKSWSTGPNYLKLVQIMKKYGFIWGGDFKTIVDEPHFEIAGFKWREYFDKFNKRNFIPNTTFVKI